MVKTTGNNPTLYEHSSIIAVPCTFLLVPCQNGRVRTAYSPEQNPDDIGLDIKPSQATSKALLCNNSTEKAKVSITLKCKGQLG